MRQYLDGQTMEQVAIKRIQAFEARALAMHPAGYWLGDSGGKDSSVVLDLTKRAGVKFEAHFTYTAEPPEVVEFVKEHHPETIRHWPPQSMWELIETYGPPTRQHRWCCAKLQKKGGAGRLVITGVRAAESYMRRKRHWTEQCKDGLGRWLLHPIFDWPTEAVWEYIRERRLPYCHLYDEGRTRIGCVMCPKANNWKADAERWPKMAQAYRKALAKKWKRSETAQARFATPDEFYEWWISGKSAPPRRAEYGEPPVERKHTAALAKLRALVEKHKGGRLPGREAIAKEVGIAGTTVIKYLRELGIQPNARGRPRKHGTTSSST